MPDANKTFRKKRIGIGAALASFVTLLIFISWRFAAIFDADLGPEGWRSLGFEAAFLLNSLPIVALAYSGLGAFLVKRGPGTRVYSAVLSAAIGLALGLAFAALGLFEIEQGGALNSTPAAIIAMALSALVGGYVGHAGWFPPASISE